VKITNKSFGTTEEVEFIYDYTGRRVRKIDNSAIETIYASSFYEIKEGVVTKHIFDGVRRIVSKKGGNIFWYHTDHLGSTGFLTTEQDVNGDVQVIQKTTYFPFGETKEVPPVEEVQYKFTGQEYDPETGLYYYGARYYDPVIGRFVSADIYIPYPLDSQSFNRYTYVRNNPIIYNDPTGHWFGIDDAIAAGIGFVVGYIRHGVTTGDWGWEAVKAGAIGAVVAWIGYNTLGLAANELANMWNAAGLGNAGGSFELFGVSISCFTEEIMNWLFPKSPKSKNASDREVPIATRAKQGKGGDIIYYYGYEGYYENWSGGSLTWRLNNPGAIEWGAFAIEHGAIGNANRWAIFPNYQTGYNAASSLLNSNRYSRLTVNEAIGKWAPDNENDTAAYQRFIKSKTGINPNSIMRSLTPQQRSSLLEAIIQYEHYEPGTITREYVY